MKPLNRFFNVVWHVLGPLVRILHPLEVSGLEHLPPMGHAVCQPLQQLGSRPHRHHHAGELPAADYGQGFPVPYPGTGAHCGKAGGFPGGSRQF